MTGSTALLDPSPHIGELKRGERPCWPIVWLWVLSIAQYGYRYILQVNDPATSFQYAATPAPLSAIKYGLFLSFALFALFRLSRRPLSLTRTYKRLLSILGAAFAVLAVVVLIRLSVAPGDLNQTGLCALQFLPWMASLFLVPLVFGPEHSLTSTLMAFERITFRIIFPFWLATVILAVLDIRYPALSYQGLLLRFGGILDDPNGYACLCLFFIVLAAAGRPRFWQLKVTIYVVMLLGTLSLTGYVTATVMAIGLLLSRIARPTVPSKSSIMRQLVSGLGIICLLLLGAAIYQTNEAVSAITSVYEAKSNSRTTHISNLFPDEEMLDTTSPVSLLTGIGGFSEDLYWRVLVNFGWLGLIAIAALMFSSAYFAMNRPSRWRYSTGLWIMGVLVGSNGISYLMTFPVSLIYWSLLGLLICAKNAGDTNLGMCTRQIGAPRYPKAHEHAY